LGEVGGWRDRWDFAGLRCKVLCSVLGIRRFLGVRVCIDTYRRCKMDEGIERKGQDRKEGWGSGMGAICLLYLLGSLGGEKRDGSAMM
jgi:hypothetical protein